ncbi:MAG: EAL domain-containing protein [Actinobacteria bacterium]|nr:EAL domain-containing protein [Actinomycetota bacterium]
MSPLDRDRGPDEARRRPAIGRGEEVEREERRDGRWDRRTRIANLDRVAYEAVLVVDPDGQYRYIDPETRWVLGYTRQQLAEQTFDHLVHPDDLGAAAEAFESVVDHPGDQARVEFRIRHQAGEYRWYEVAFKNLRNDPRTGGIAARFHDVSDRREAEQAVRASEERWRALVQHSYDALVVTDEHNVIAYATPSIEQMFGWSVDELIGANGFDYVHPDDVQEAQDRGLAIVAEPGGSIIGEYRLRASDGSYRWVESIATNLSTHPNVGGFVQSFRDVTFRKEADAQVRASEERLTAMLENADGATLLLDQAARARWVSPGGEGLWGLARGELSDRRLFHLVHHDDRDEAVRLYTKLVDSPAKDTVRIEGRMLHGDGSYRWYEAVCTNCLDDPSVNGIVANVRDVSYRVMAELALRESEAKLEFQATHDPLTQLPNRTLLFDRMQDALQRVREGVSGGGVAVLFCDLDNFKFVNDSHGHSLGDELLSAVARRLETSVPDEVTLARFGGDEFVIVAVALEDEGEAWLLAERVTESLREPFATARGDVFVTCSIGIAFTSSADRRSEDLIRDADSAMYQAKDRGRARIETFNAGMRARAVEWHDIERGLRRAIRRHELRVHYQPIVDLGDERIVGVEALVRWQHPERGLLPPGAFIGVAEQTGLIVPMGAWILDRACSQVKQWQRTVPGQEDLWLAVNLSARQLQDETLTDDMSNVLAASGIEPQLVHAEITESELMRDVTHTRDVLERLKVLGVRVAIDDFGTGYSSFSYLRLLPVDALKIDRSFVTHLDQPRPDEAPSDDLALVDGMIQLAHTLRMEVVAEGVETEAQGDLLRQRSCDFAQGYHYAEPLAPADLRALLDGRRTSLS